MSSLGQRQARLSEEDVESILRDFYRQEMPAELRRVEHRAGSAELSRSGPPDRAAGRRAAVGITVAACSLLLAVIALQTGEDDIQSNRSDGGDAKSASVANEDGDSRRAASVADANDKSTKNGRVSAFPRRYVPVEFQWMRELKPVYDDLRETFVGEYLHDQFADDWNRALEIEQIRFPETDKKASKSPAIDPPRKLPEQQ